MPAARVRTDYLLEDMFGLKWEMLHALEGLSRNGAWYTLRKWRCLETHALQDPLALVFDVALLAALSVL